MQLVSSRDPDDLLVPLFKNMAIKNEAKSKEEGRPIYDDIEVVEVRIPGSRNFGVHPATERWQWKTDAEGNQIEETYAERFAKQYRQFKAQNAQTKSGTPLAHLPFLTEGKRAEFRAQNIYTAEQLAAVDGQELKNLGPGGREFKNNAIEYISEAKASVPTLQMQAELEALRARNAVLEDDNEAMKARAASAEAEFEEMSEEQLRAYIKTNTGHPPQGLLPRKTLIRMAVDARPTRVA